MNLHVTPRETQVIELLNAGMAQKEIAEVLGCSVGTIDTHIKNIKAKTGLQKATEIGCAYTWKKYRLPLIDLPEKVRRRIAAALLVLSIAGMLAHADFLRVLRPASRTAPTVRTTRARRGRRSDEYLYKVA